MGVRVVKRNTLGLHRIVPLHDGAITSCLCVVQLYNGRKYLMLGLGMFSSEFVGHILME